MKQNEKIQIKNAPPIGYWSNSTFCGIAIKAIKHDIDDYLIFVGFRGSRESVHRIKIQSDSMGDFIRWYGMRIPLDEILRAD